MTPAQTIQKKSSLKFDHQKIQNEKRYGYNMGACSVELYSKVDSEDVKKQAVKLNKIANFNAIIKDCSNFTDSLTDALSRKIKADLSKNPEQKALLERLKSAGVLSANNTTTVWDLEKIKPQLDIVKEKCQQFGQQQQLILTEMNADRESTQEMYKAASKMVEESNRLIKNIIDRTK